MIQIAACFTSNLHVTCSKLTLKKLEQQNDDNNALLGFKFLTLMPSKIFPAAKCLNIPRELVNDLKIPSFI